MAEDNHAEEAKSIVADRVSLVLTLVVVAVFAIFTGYLVGQYAIRWVAAPLGETPGVASTGSAPRTTAAGSASSPVAGSQTAGSGSATSVATQSAPSSTTATTQTAQSQAPTSQGPTSQATAQAPAPQTAAGQEAPRAEVVRVQIGHFATRDEATRVADALKAGTPAVPDAWVLFDAQRGEYRVQAGAFSSRARAEEFAAELVARGYDAYLAP